MKKLTGILILLLTLACSSDNVERNPYLPEARFSERIDIDLPLYSSVNIPGSAIYINNVGVGIRGVFLANTGSGFIAFEASCPNHTPNNCSTMTITGGINCICSCEDYEYNLFNGQYVGEPDGEKKYPLLNYRTTVSGSSVIISN